MPIFLFVVLLLIDGGLNPIIAHVLAFIGGLCLVTIPDLIRKKLSPTEFIIRIIQIMGLVIIGGLIWQDRKIKEGFLIYIMLVTLFTDLFISIIVKKGREWIMNKSKDITNE